jgi:shikimate kinase
MSDHRRNLILAGFMATGKTSVGRLVADRLGMAFTDTDQEVEAMAGRDIADIFAVSGEAAFRQLEAILCLRAAIAGGRVIATGGGALLNQNSRMALEGSGLIVCLTARIDEIVRRVGDWAKRPSGGSAADLESLFARRSALYDSLPHQVDTTGKQASDVAEEVMGLWRAHS